MLTNSERLKIIAEAKKSGYKGSYLDLLKQHEEGGFANDINKPEKSTYVDARSGYGFPTTYQDGGVEEEEMRAGGFANLPDPDPKPTMSQSLQRFMKEKHMPPMKTFQDGGAKTDTTIVQQADPLYNPVQTVARRLDELKFDEAGIAYDIETGERFSGDIIYDSPTENISKKPDPVGLYYSRYGASTSGKQDKDGLYYHVGDPKSEDYGIYTRDEYKQLLKSLSLPPENK